MNFYPHHISDFNNATRHLTRVERSVYRDAIELYYDTESVLTDNLERLLKRLLCVSDEEKTALKDVLEEFFELQDDGYFHERCDVEICKYRANISAKARAGIASAEARKKKATERKQKLTRVKSSSTPVHNQEPITNNQEPIEKTCPEPVGTEPAIIVFELPTNKFNTQNETALITEQMFIEWVETYPAVDVMQALKEMRAWLNANPTKRKTKGGIAGFAAKWLAKDQNRGRSNGQYQTANEKAAERNRATRDYETATNF